MKVPDTLVSGNHEEIKSWRRQKSIERTLERRKDLMSYHNNLDPSNINKIRFKNENHSYPDW